MFVTMAGSFVRKLDGLPVHDVKKHLPSEHRLNIKHDLPFHEQISHSWRSLLGDKQHTELWENMKFILLP